MSNSDRTHKDGKVLTCFCEEPMGRMFDENGLIKHLTDCKVFKTESPLSVEFSQIPFEDLDLEPLYILRAELLSYILQVENTIHSKNGEIRTTVSSILLKQAPQINKKEGTQSLKDELDSLMRKIEVEPKEKVVKEQNTAVASNTGNKLSRMNSSAGKEWTLSQPENVDMVALYSRENKTQCNGCAEFFDSDLDFDKLWFLSICCDVFCKKCLYKQIAETYIAKKGCLKCQKCTSNIDSSDIENVLGKEKFEKYNLQLCENLCDFVVCLKCNQKFDFQPGDPGSSVSDKNGKPLSKAHLQHYSLNRFICPSAACRTEQCRACKSVPYHLGYECDDFQSFQSSKRCRYCDTGIKNTDKQRKEKAFKDICYDKECESKRKFACAQVLECGHGCCGVKDEIKCLPCLQEDCAKKDESLNGVTGDEYCNICFVEGLINAPVIRSKCGHMFHYACLKKKLEIKWLSPRIVFNFCLCPLCKAWLDLPPDSDLYESLEGHRQLFLSIQDKSMKRLQNEGREKDEKLTKKESGYFEKPLEYAMAIYSYYMCFKCKKPYFGGLKDCERALNDDKKEYSPKDLICPNCCDIPIAKCKRHGDDFIEFKCRYCCSLAVWFCFGTTHFCEPCHANVARVQKTPKNALPVCKGKNGCPFKGEHNPNGEETSMGCSICRDIKNQASDF